MLVTTSSKQEAENIAQKLLEHKLIACANIVGPVSSHFHWSGKIERAEEYLILMKSRSDLLGEISKAVDELHSYDVPEVLCLPVVGGSEGYLGWLEATLRQT